MLSNEIGGWSDFFDRSIFYVKRMVLKDLVWVSPGNNLRMRDEH